MRKPGPTERSIASLPLPLTADCTISAITITAPSITRV